MTRIVLVGAGFFASYIAVVQQIGEVSSGGYFLIFWMFQNPPDLLYSLIKAMAMAFVIVIVGGLGSMAGALLGGVVIGASEALAGLFITPSSKSMVSFGLLILILLLRPQGLLGRPA